MTGSRPTVTVVPFAAVIVCLTLAACSPTAAGVTAAPRTSASASLGSAPVIYAAIGASETVGVGTADHLRQAWPQLFFNSALPQSAIFYNFGVPGATTAEAIDLQLPDAVKVHPTLVTIWLNVNDLLAGVPSDTYEAELRTLVGAIHAAGTRQILIANTPYLDQLPAYLACITPGSSTLRCAVSTPVPDATHLDAVVDAYNAATARVASQEGAVLVDLHAQGEVPQTHPDWLASDGFHPNAQGAAAIAAAFKVAFVQASPRR